MKNRFSKNQIGYTLIEILITVSIIGILSSIVLGGLRITKEKARNTRRLADVNEIVNAIELYRQANEDTSPGEDGVEYINGDPYWIPELAPTYIPVVPSDPIDKDEYKYHYLRQGKNYEVAAFIEEHGGDPTCDDSGPAGCDYYEKTNGTFLAVFNPGASGWNMGGATSTPPPPPPSPEPTPTPPPAPPPPPPPPPADTTPPTISDIQVTNITETSAYVSWTTSESTTDNFYYAQSSPVPASPTLSKVTGTITTSSHRVTLNNLTASTTYYFLISSQDTSGNTATSSEQSFMTLVPTPSAQSPIISNIQISNLTATTVTISWITDVPATGQVDYALSKPVKTAYGTWSLIIGTQYLTSHSFTFSILYPASSYWFFITATDANGNKNKTNDLPFTTLALGPPVICPGMVGVVHDQIINNKLAFPKDIFVSGNYAYVALDYPTNRLTIIDISNPSQPVIASNLYDGINLYSANSVYVSGNYAYVTSDSKLAIINISNPSSPVLTGVLADAVKLNKPRSVAVQGNYAYIASQTGDSITIIDVSNPASPLIVGFLSDSSRLDSAASLKVSGNFVYVTSPGTSRVTIVDISNPASLQIVGSVQDATLLNYPGKIFVSGNYAYVTSSNAKRLNIIDISNPAAPIITGSYQDTVKLNYPTSIFVLGSRAYVTGENYHYLNVFDISNPASPSLINSITDGSLLRWPKAVFVQGNYAYVGSSAGQWGGVTALDLSRCVE